MSTEIKDNHYVKMPDEMVNNNNNHKNGRIILDRKYNSNIMSNNAVNNSDVINNNNNVNTNVNAIDSIYLIFGVGASIILLFDFGVLCYLIVNKSNIDLTMLFMLQVDIFFIFIDILINNPALALPSAHFKKLGKLIWIIVTVIIHVLNIDFYSKNVGAIKDGDINGYIFWWHLIGNVSLCQVSRSFWNCLQICFE